MGLGFNYEMKKPETIMRASTGWVGLSYTNYENTVENSTDTRCGATQTKQTLLAPQMEIDKFYWISIYTIRYSSINKIINTNTYIKR